MSESLKSKIVSRYSKFKKESICQYILIVLANIVINNTEITTIFRPFSET